MSACFWPWSCSCPPRDVLYMWQLMTNTIYAYVFSPFCLDIQLLKGMLLYPVRIYFSTLGGEGIFVRVGVKTEFIAQRLPPRVRTAKTMGHREDPPSQWGRLLWQERGRRSPCSCGCEAMENSASEDKH